MSGEKNLTVLLQSMSPTLNEGDYVFCTVADLNDIELSEVISFFKEKEAFTLILEKQMADRIGLTYTYIAAWITLTVHSSLEAVGLTAAFSNSLAQNGISCNVVAAFYHDHIFVEKEKADEAMKVLWELTK